MTFSQIMYFQAVCKYQNVTLAANALFVSQPTISIAIKELEQEFDVRLFFRKNKQLILTREGAYFLAQVNKILALHEETKASMREFSNSHPVLRLGLTPVLSIFFFDHFFRPFQDAHPNIQLEISEHSMNHIFHALKETTLDVVLTFLDEEQEEGFETLPLLTTPLCFCVSKSHPVCILRGKQHLFRSYGPVYPDGFVIVTDGSLGLGSIYIVHFVSKNGFVAQHQEAVGKAAGDEELAFVVFAQFYADISSKSRGRFPQINRHVEYTAFNDAHQFGLAELTFLIMESAQDSERRFRLVVLHKMDRTYILAKLLFFERFHKITAGVVEHLRLNDPHSVNFSLYIIHDT